MLLIQYLFSIILLSTYVCTDLHLQNYVVSFLLLSTITKKKQYM